MNTFVLRAAATAVAGLALAGCSLIGGEAEPSESGIPAARSDYSVNDMRDFQPSGTGWSTSGSPTAEPAATFFGYLDGYFTRTAVDPARCADMLTTLRLVTDADGTSDWGEDTMVYFPVASNPGGAVPTEITARVFRNDGRAQEFYDSVVSLGNSCASGYEYEWLTETWYVDSVSTNTVAVPEIGEFVSVVQTDVTGSLYGVTDPGNYVTYVGIRGNVVFSTVHVDPDSQALAAAFETLFTEFAEELG